MHADHVVPTRSQYPDTPLERLRELRDPSVVFYDARVEQYVAALDPQEPAEDMKAYATLMELLGLDWESRTHLSLLDSLSLDGHREANKILWHLIKYRRTLREPACARVPGHVRRSWPEARAAGHTG